MKSKTFAFRAPPDLRRRLERLATALERDYTWIIEKAIEGHLPVLEARYAKELAELDGSGSPAASSTPARAALHSALAQDLQARKKTPPK